VERKNRLHRFRRLVCKLILHTSHWQARVVRIIRNKWIPGGDVNPDRESWIRQVDLRKRKTCRKGSLVKTGQPEEFPPSSIPRGIEHITPREHNLPIRHRSCQHASQIGRFVIPFYRNRRKQDRLKIDIGVVSQRHLGKRPCSFDRNHPRADPAKRESNPVQAFFFVGEHRGESLNRYIRPFRRDAAPGLAPRDRVPPP